MIVKSLFKYLPLCPMVLTFVSCGKKMPQDTGSESQRQEVNLPKSIFLQAIKAKTAKATFQKDGDIIIPSIVLSESSVSNQHQIRLEVNYLNGEPEFFCTWTGAGNLYRFTRCADLDGRDFGLTEANIEKFIFPIDQGKEIHFKLTHSPISDNTTTANISIPVTWK
ncbi:MAG: hypothetical protein LW878_06100 [Proteobacteria bacterium]|nr:hypothetical protein [Pseudomonadota bacterium]